MALDLFKETASTPVNLYRLLSEIGGYTTLKKRSL